MKKNTDLFILNGLSGQLLNHIFEANHDAGSILGKVNLILNNLIDVDNFSFSNGLGGIFWSMELLNQHILKKNNQVLELDQIDDFLYSINKPNVYDTYRKLPDLFGQISYLQLRLENRYINKYKKEPLKYVFLNILRQFLDGVIRKEIKFGSCLEICIYLLKISFIARIGIQRQRCKEVLERKIDEILSFFLYNPCFTDKMNVVYMAKIRELIALCRSQFFINIDKAKYDFFYNLFFDRDLSNDGDCNFEILKKLDTNVGIEISRINLQTILSDLYLTELLSCVSELKISKYVINTKISC
ncbi:MAG: hypothetical protein LBF27_31180 [Sphingobacterium sp.]|jgi:hypothetical protein|nr:hypothetical protein [Sphingobacterium sp.]